MRNQPWHPLLVGLPLVQFVLFVPLAWWVRKHPMLSTDVEISQVLQKKQSAFLDNLSRILSAVGSATTTTILALLVSLALWREQRRLEAVITTCVSITSVLVRRSLQQLVHRSRPCEPLVRVNTKKKTPSFPSGHATASTTVWGWFIALILLLLPGSRFRKGVLTAFPALVILLVGPSRIYLGEHWATDVVGGYLLGSTWVGIALPLYFRLRNDKK
jgi:membrane-associated phospholipid phosphatase